ncbi:MAG: sulfatase-like hydrolase/transferase [Akkermansiaceae bacterium]
MIRFITLLITFTCCLTALAAAKPNVIIFLMDDMGYGDVQRFNPKCAIPTKNLNRLAEEGLYFTHGHSSASVCAPSRYALLTGNRVYRGKRPMGTWAPFGGSQIRAGQLTLSKHLQNAGYTTAFFGKFHLGGKSNGLSNKFSAGPIDQGFDYSLTLPSGIQSNPYAFYKNDRLSRWNPKRKAFEHFANDAEAKKVFTNGKMDNWSTATVGPLLTRDALAFIDRHHEENGAKKPFFMYYCSQAGHTPYKPPATFNVDAPTEVKDGAIKIKGQTTNIRTDMIYEADVSVGLFLDKLKEKGMHSNTLFVFTSDNGVAKGIDAKWTNPIYKDIKDGPYGGERIEPGANSTDHVNGQGVENGIPLRGKKGYCFEGGHRVPMIFHWPGKIKPQAVDDELFVLHDFFRTISGLLNLNVPAGQAIDSVDFSQRLLNQHTRHPVRGQLLVQSNRPVYGKDKKQIGWSFYKIDTIADKRTIQKALINNDKNKPVENARKSSLIEIYDLSTDPGENAPIKNTKTGRALHDLYKKALTE